MFPGGSHVVWAESSGCLHGACPACWCVSHLSRPGCPGLFPFLLNPGRVVNPRPRALSEVP